MRPGELRSADRPINPSLLKQPSGWIPVVMSLIGLSLVLAHYASVGIVHEADEGTLAHLWQLLMAGQLPIAAFFAFKWVPKDPRRAILVLALQAAAGLASMASVYFLTSG